MESSIDQVEPLASSLAATPQSTTEHAVPSRISKVWSVHLLILAGGLAALTVLFSQTLRSMLGLWDSGNYSHCFLIVPISCWLIWHERKRLKTLVPSASFSALLVIAGLSMMWFVGELGEANLIRQLAVVAMVPALVWAILGRRIATAIWFPLGYLLFAVPIGASLIPRLQDFTAWFTVSALRATGIPALLDGRLIYISSGTWEVAEACSGIRYLVSTLVLGVLFTHLVYRSWKRKALFLGACFAVPILANGIRAYSIVLFAHKVNQQMAMGIDHLIYGWFFNSLVTISLLAIAFIWREKGLHDDDDSIGRFPESSQLTVTRQHSVVVAAVVLAAFVCLGGSVRLWEHEITKPGAHSGVFHLAPISVVSPWAREPGVVATPIAKFSNADVWETDQFTDGAHNVQFYVAYYANQRHGAQLIAAGNGLDRSEWRTLSESRHRAKGSSINEEVVANSFGTQVVWYWYYVDGRQTASSNIAKLRHATGLLLRKRNDAGAVFVSTPVITSRAEAEEVLQSFCDESSISDIFQSDPTQESRAGQ